MKTNDFVVFVGTKNEEHEITKMLKLADFGISEEEDKTHPIRWNGGGGGTRGWLFVIPVCSTLFSDRDC